MFTPEERDRLREQLVLAAHADPTILGAALTGSAAAQREDRWSDIDLALSVDVDADYDQVIADWTHRMYEKHGAAHHVDVIWNATVFRVFLLVNTLQVDIAFWPEADFGAIAPTFRLLFGAANQREPLPAPVAEHLIGMGWLYALHARSSIARGRLWQAEYMISQVRDHVWALACLRHELPTSEGRGMDSLPAEIRTVITDALVRSVDGSELRRAFEAVTELLISEIDEVDPDLARRLSPLLRELSAPDRT
jgi:hypothetical protein